MDFGSINVVFTDESTLDSDEAIFEILFESVTTEYLMNEIQSITGTPFQLATEVFFAAADQILPP